MSPTAPHSPAAGPKPKPGRKRLDIGPILIQLEQARREAMEPETASASVTPTIHPDLASGRRSLTFEQLALLCLYFDVPLRTLFPDHSTLRGRPRRAKR